MGLRTCSLGQASGSGIPVPGSDGPGATDGSVVGWTVGVGAGVAPCTGADVPVSERGGVPGTMGAAGAAGAVGSWIPGPIGVTPGGGVTSLLCSLPSRHVVGGQVGVGVGVGVGVVGGVVGGIAGRRHGLWQSTKTPVPF